ncbi:MAG: SufD family Fe-S cluster assembly protein [Candidatus Pacebacteria bacterium]|nr:SufD family Fe-S cluster assembly protein [Candidatus Paceibacterota bacterium]
MTKSTPKLITIIVDKDTNYIIEKTGSYAFEIVTEGIKLDIFSALQAKGNKTVELNVLIHHQVPNTTAQTTLKAVGYDQSTLVMKAKILIDPGCHQTESFLTERALLISKDAHALAIPDLEILTDDVKCSHAASVTKIPEEQIFYLASRGISRKKAEEMIVEGFLKMRE